MNDNLGYLNCRGFKKCQWTPRGKKKPNKHQMLMEVEKHRKVREQKISLVQHENNRSQ